MLKDWILDIKNKSHHYCSNDWKFRISGHLVEISVSPQIIGKQLEYRCAVITIGQILKILSLKIEKSGSNYHIQSFPNLEAPEIIATIRVADPIEKSEDPFPVLEKEIFDSNSEDKLRSIAEKYQFNIAKMDQPFNFRISIDYFKDRTWFILTSKHDNPFIWINLGSLKSAILLNGQVFPSIESIFILDFCSREDWERIKLSFPVKDHLQAAIAIRN